MISENMKRVTIISVALVILIIGVGVLHSMRNGSEDPIITDSGISVERRSITELVTATGIVKSQTGAEVKVGAQVSGVVKKLYVRVGSKVKKGMLLAEIEPAGYRARTDQAAARVKIAATEKKFAELELNRMTSLRNSGSGTQQQLEAAQRAYELTASGLQQAEADLSFEELELSYTKIISPIDGVVSSVTTREGETVAANFTAPTFVTVIDLERLEVWAYVDETDIGRIEKNQKVSFTVDTYPGEEFYGSVAAIYPKAEIQNNVVNYIAVIDFDKKYGKIIRPEMTASVRISSGGKEGILAVPKSCVKKEGGRTFIYLLRNGKAVKSEVRTGISDKKYTEIISGLGLSEKVINNLKSQEEK
jgi:HlyD family secretion protein